MVSSFKPHRAYKGNLYFILSCTCKNQHISHEDTGKGNTEVKVEHRGSLPFTHVHVRLLADKVCKSSPHSLDRGQSKHNLLSSIDIRIQHTQNMLKILICDERLQTSPEHKSLTVDLSGIGSSQQ
jgi:hypothetical protein